MMNTAAESAENRTVPIPGTTNGNSVRSEELGKKQGKICSIHASDETEDSPILLFHQTSLTKCRLIRQIRHENSLKYASVILPDAVDDIHGYHIACYRKFVALPKRHRQSIAKTMEDSASSAQHSPFKTTRSKVVSVRPSIRTGIFPSVCIFCNSSRKKVRGIEQKLISAKTRKFEFNIRKFMKWRHDKRLIARLQGVHFSVKEVKYHGCCRVKYQSEAERVKRNESKEGNQENCFSYLHNVREAHKRSFKYLVAYLQDTVISKQEVHSLRTVTSLYNHLLREFAEDQDIAECKEWRLSDKIRNFFDGGILVKKRPGKKVAVIYSAKMSEIEAMHKLSENENEVTEKIRDVALMLRQEIKRAEKRTLPDQLKLEDVEQGEVTIPSQLVTFFEYLIGGPDVEISGTPLKKIRANSVAQDVVFSASSGRKKLKKHLMLGIALKSLTSSRKVLEMLNKLGHCASYHTILEVETELTFEAAKDGLTSPHGMVLHPEYGTGVAWDNFDRYVETESGKDTLHDTVGISYQSFPLTSKSEQSDAVPAYESPASTSLKKRRRTYESHSLDIEHYWKKPRIVNCNFLGLQDERRAKFESSLSPVTESWKADVLWMSNFLENHRTMTPMWTGWNSKFLEDQEYIQKVWYLPQINQSPTSRSVVAETMKRSLEIADEAGRCTICVTYDLAIAKLGMQIQVEESPKFDRIFIALGPFHIEMAFFSAIGKVLAESGGPEILNESEVLASGSLRSFLRGKNYNRCRKMHEILSVSVEALHFQSFINCAEEGEELLALINTELDRIQSSFSPERYLISEELESLFKKYSKYCQDTRDEHHGKTAQFWIQYIDFLHLYHDFMRSIRCGDLNLYISCLPKIANCFFALNHLNYARWIVKYYDDLLKLPDTHPEVFQDFQKGWFSIKRTKKPFSCTPIDLTLEQTINAHSANQRQGIAFLTNSISARQRWAESHFLRMSIISKLLDDLGMTRVEDICKDLKISRMKNDKARIEKVIEMIKDTINPFEEGSEKHHLYNLVTGKAVSNAAESFLLNINKIGESERQRFIRECMENPARFEKRIQCQKIRTFATESGVKKLKAVEGKLIEACLIRDIFGSLLCYSLQNSIDINEVLKYPLAPIPLSLCHVDGTILKSPKSALMRHLESRVESSCPLTIDVTIVDAMFFLHLQQNLPGTYGGVATYILTRLMALSGNEIHFVSDKWIQPSIKGYERQVRTASMAKDVYAIQGANQKRPGNWSTALMSSSFKTGLVDFLIEFWKDDSFAEILGNKVLVANAGDECYRYAVENGIVKREDAPDFYSTHEEADNRMFFHLSRLSSPRNVVVRTSDTDCLVIVLGCKHLLNPSINIWLEVGVHGNNTQRFIDINCLHSVLGESLCKALPAYHAFTGCDYTASFSRRGKVAPLKILEKDINTQRTFAVVGIDELNVDTYEVFERYVCRMYGRKGFITRVDDARTAIFFDKYRMNNEELLSAKKLDASIMPPCQKVLVQKVKRTCFIAKRWMSAVLPHPPSDDPATAGWTLEDGEYRIHWFEGNATPRNMDITCHDDDDVEEIAEEPDIHDIDGSDDDK